MHSISNTITRRLALFSARQSSTTTTTASRSILPLIAPPTTSLFSSPSRTIRSRSYAMASNSAAWLTAAKSPAFEVKEAPLWTAEAGEILVENKAVAINPVDGSLQAFAWWPMNYPTVLGQDVAGVVVSVGSGVTRFKKGDRVVGHALGMATKRDQDNAFQNYTILTQHMTSAIPDGISYESAAVIPLGCSTAACGLFQDAPFLGLDYPTSPRRPSNGKTILVWGGSSSVGSNAIQLALAAGYDVLATASPKNFAYVKSLGAYAVVDYSSPSVEADLISALGGKTLAGVLDAIGGDATIVSSKVLAATAGAGRIATTKGAADYTPPAGVEIKRIFGTTLANNAVGAAIYESFLPAALAAGSFVPSPQPEVTGSGLGAVQGAVDAIMKGVSAKKLVVTL